MIAYSSFNSVHIISPYQAFQWHDIQFGEDVRISLRRWVVSSSNSCFHGKLTDWSKSPISKSLHFFCNSIYLFIVNYYLLL